MRFWNMTSFTHENLRMKNSIEARARELALAMTKIPSVTGSAAEITFAQTFLPHLKAFDKSWTEPIPGEASGRSNLFAIKRGTSKDAIVLTGHFDVVSISDYGSLQALACDPEALLPETIARLKETGENALALADFESGDFLPGRGLLDMKAGLAAGLAAMEAYEGKATLVFLGVADEEERSAGARAAAPQLAALASAENLNIKLVINLDAISDQEEGTKARVVATGSIGKQLLTAFIVGKQTHAGYPQDGVNAAYVMAELIRDFELAPELSEVTYGEVAAPPTTLFAKDLKHGYNVTTPATAFAYWNTMQHRRSADDVMKIAKVLAAAALSRVTARTGRNIEILSFADVAKMVGLAKVKDIATAVAGQGHLDLPEQSRLVTQALWQFIGLSGPAVVLGFGSIPYPAVSLQDQHLEAEILAALKPLGIGAQKYFAGISDMSFLGEASGNLAAVAANTPIWGTSFMMPEPAGYPIVNLGPWGRDYHHWLERLHTPYAFNVLPHALLAVIEAVTKS